MQTLQLAPFTSGVCMQKIIYPPGLKSSRGLCNSEFLGLYVCAVACAGCWDSGGGGTFPKSQFPEYPNGDDVRVKPALRAVYREAHHRWCPGAHLRAPGGGPGGQSPRKLLGFSILKAKKSTPGSIFHI